jgi:hypothetical protein
MFQGALYVELFCQTVHQNSSNSTGRVVCGAETKKNGFTDEVEMYQVKMICIHLSFVSYYINNMVCLLLEFKI